MPRDVMLGEGYDGDTMIDPVAPGQHAGHFRLMEGSSVLLSDSGMGRPPRGRRGGGHRHRGPRGHGWGPGPWWGYGPVFYEPLYVESISARKPFILDQSDEADEEKKRESLKGLGTTDQMECIQRVIQAAAVGAREAVEGVKQGKLKSMREVCEHIRRRACAEIHEQHARYAKAASQAVQSGFEAARPHVEKLLASQGVPDATGEAGHQGVSGIGDWKGDIAAAVASGELDQLMSGVRKTQDTLISAINARGPVIESYLRAKSLYEDARAKYGSPFIGGIPNVNVFPATEAFSGAQEGVKLFARQVQTLLELEVVLAKVSEGLFGAGLTAEEGSVNEALRQIRRFTVETDGMFRAIPEYGQTKLKIVQAFNAGLAARRINFSQSDDPQWFEAYLMAAEQVVPMPQGAGASGVAGLGDLGLAPVLVVLLKVIGIIAATVVAIHAINKITSALNSKAETARELILQRERDWTQMESGMRQQGKSQAEIDAARKSWDAGTKESVAKIPEPSGIFGGVTSALLAVAAGAAALKIGGVI